MDRNTTSTAADPTGGGSSGLDCILKNTEFENTQQAKAIETERERIQAYEKQLEEKLRQRRELEESTLSLEEQAERLNKQLELNRENYGSLKRTTVVLDEHKEALQRKRKATLLEYEQQKAHHEQALSKYEDIWASYHAKYEGFAKAQELQKKFEELQLVDEQHTTLEEQIQGLDSSLQLECDNQLECYDQRVTRILQIASWCVDTKDSTKTAAANEERAELLLKQVAELEEGVAKAEAVLRVQEADKLQDDHDVAMEEEPNSHFSTNEMPSGLLPDVNPSVPERLVVSAVRQHAPSQQLTTPMLLAHCPTSQSLVYSKPTTQSSARNVFTLPQIPARPISNSSVSEKTDAVGAKLIKPPPISLPVLKRSAANTSTTPAGQSLGSSRYLLEIPLRSLPTRSSTTARNEKVSLQSEPRGQSLERENAASTPTPSINIPARPHLQIPSLTTPSRPQPPTTSLSMAQEKATQQPKASHQLMPGFQLTIPVTQVQNMHNERSKEITPSQGGTTSRASKVLGCESSAQISKLNSESDVHSLEKMPAEIQKSLPVPDVEDKNGSTQNWEDGSDEQPDQQCDKEASQNTEVDASAYEGYYSSDMQDYMQQYAMYGGQILEYADSGVMMQIPQGEEADGLGTEPLEGANEFFPSANESAPGGFLYGGFGLSGAADGFSGGFSFLPESGSQSEGGISSNKASQPGMSFSLFEGGSPGVSTQTQGGSGFAFSFGGHPSADTSAPASSRFSFF